MVPDWLTRTELLIGAENIEKLQKSHVLIVGLGGVGAVAAEMICRAGVGEMTIVDGDVVEPTNRNRQLPALVSTDGLSKAEVLGARFLDINPDLKLHMRNLYIRDGVTSELLHAAKYDYAVDCIDTLSPKVYYLLECMELGIPVVASMGAGGKLDPTQVKVVDISETYNCNLARYVRKKLHQKGFYKGLKVAFSPELPAGKITVNPEGGPKKSTIGTMSYLPAAFGLAVASVVIRDLIDKK